MLIHVIDRKAFCDSRNSPIRRCAGRSGRGRLAKLSQCHHTVISDLVGVAVTITALALEPTANGERGIGYVHTRCTTLILFSLVSVCTL